MGNRVGKGSVLVVGAGGDVGRGIVAAALGAGREVIAVGRSEKPLAALARDHRSDRLATIAGDISDEVRALALWDRAVAAFDGVSDVVIAVNAPYTPLALGEAGVDDIAAVFAGNVLPHFVAAKTFLSRMPEQGMFLGIGGGTADFIFPGMAPVSMAQAALRMLYRGLARERRTGPEVRELMIVSMVAGQSNRDTASPDWVTDLEVGRHVMAILDAPERFPKPILNLRSRERVGLPEADA